MNKKQTEEENSDTQDCIFRHEQYCDKRLKKKKMTEFGPENIMNEILTNANDIEARVDFHG